MLRFRKLGALGATLFVLSSTVAFCNVCGDISAQLPGLVSRMREAAGEIRSKALYELIACGVSVENGRPSFMLALRSLFKSNPDQEDMIRLTLIHLLETENQVARRAQFSEDYSNYYGDVIMAVAVINDLKADPRSLDALAGAITTGNMAMNALAALGDAALARVQELTVATHAATRASAMLVLERMLQPSNLGKMRKPDDVRGYIKAAFLRGVKDEDPSVRSTAAGGLGKIGDRDSIPLLETLALNDPTCFAGQKSDDGTGDLCPVRLAARRAVVLLRAGK